jgi:hypothetical protein
MLSTTKQRVCIALFLMAFLVFGAVGAQAGDTGGSDRMVKGAAAGAAVGAITQVVRGRTGGKELLKGAAVGAATGAAVGAYSDYKQEKDARRDAERRADSRRYRSSDRYYGGGSRPAYRWDRDPAYARNARGGHRHNGRCHHRR